MDNLILQKKSILGSLIYYLVFALIIFLTPVQNFADDTGSGDMFNAIDKAISADPYSSVTGEIIDYRHGEVSFALGGPSLPGPNGMSVAVGWVYHNSAVPGAQMGAWELDIPKIMGASNCPSPGNSIGGLGPVLYIPGGSSKPLLKPTGSPLASGVDWVTTDHWTVQCVPSGYGINAATVKDGYLVRSPTGRIYKFFMLKTADGGPTPTGNSIAWGANTGTGGNGQPVVFVSEIDDQFGNTINFSYLSKNWSEQFNNGNNYFNNPVSLLNSITSSDGRTITFNYVTKTVNYGSALLLNTMYILNNVQAAGKTWSFQYDNCYNAHHGTVPNYFHGTSTNCDSFYPLLKTITRPDGKKWSFTYESWEDTIGDSVVIGCKATTTKPAQYQAITQVVHPNGLTANYFYADNAINAFEVTCSFERVLSLTGRTYNGTGINQLSTSYSFLTSLPNYTYSFEIGPTKMFSRKYIKGDSTTLRSSASWNRGLLVETALMPAPPSGTIPAAPPPPPPPAAPPSIVLTNLSLQYSTQPITINFVVADNLVITSANCAVDNNPAVPCTTLSSFILPTLSAGYHTITVIAKDSSGVTSTYQSLPFWVGANSAPTAPVLVTDLTSSIVPLTGNITLSATFSGVITNYTWYKNGIAIANSNSNILTITNAQMIDGAVYQVSAANGSSVTNSSAVTLTVDPSAVITIINSVLLGD